MSECGRTAAGFANGRTNARREQHEVVDRHPEERGRRAPAPDGQRQDVAPARTIGQGRDRDSHERVEHGKRDPAQHAHLEVAGGELFLDRLKRRREDLRAVHRVEGVA